MKSLSFSGSLLALALSSLSLIACVGADADELADDLADEKAAGEAGATDVIDPIAGKVETGEIRQQLAAWGIGGYSCYGSGTYTTACYQNMDTIVGRTCFLSGVGGDLRDGAVSVVRLNGNWRLEMFAAPGKTVSAGVTCISGATNITNATWTGGTAAKEITGTVTSKRRCFITNVMNLNSTYNGFDNSADYGKVWKDSAGKWWLGGSIVGSGTPLVGAICVDVPSYHSIWNIIGAGSFTAATGVTNVACGLTKVGGQYIGGASDSLNINYSFGVHDWIFSAGANKFGTSDCVQ